MVPAPRLEDCMSLYGGRPGSSGGHLMGLSSLSITLGGHAGQHGACFRASQDWKLGDSQWVPNLRPHFRVGRRLLGCRGTTPETVTVMTSTSLSYFWSPEVHYSSKGGHSTHAFAVFVFCFVSPSLWANTARPQAFLCHLRVLSDPAAAHQAAGPVCAVCTVYVRSERPCGPSS